MSAIKHTEIFDFESYKAGIKEAEINSKQFGKTVTEVIARLNGQNKELNATLQGIAKILKTFDVGFNGKKALEDYKVSIVGVRKEMSELKAVEQGLASIRNTNKASVEQLKAEYSGLKKQLERLKPDQQGYAEDVDRINQRLKLVVPQIKQFSDATRQSKFNLDAAEGSYRKMQIELSKMRTQLTLIPGAFDAVTGKINKNNREAVALASKIGILDAALKKADKTMGVYVRNVGNYQSAFGGLNSALGMLGASALSIGTVLTGLNSIVNTSAQFQALEAAIRATTDSEEDFANTMQFLVTLADKYGQSVEVVAGSYKSLAAAAKGTSLEGQATKKIFESVVVAGTALKLTNEQVTGSLNAIQQMISKGKVSSEELRQQLGERLPGAFGLFAKAAGVSTAQLDKMLKAGEVIASDVLPKFAQVLNDTYSESAIKNAQGLVNETNRLTNAWQRFSSAFDNTTSLGRALGSFKGFLADSLNAVEVFLRNPSVGSLLGLFNGQNSFQAGQDQKRAQQVQEFRNRDAGGRAQGVREQMGRVEIAAENLNKLKALPRPTTASVQAGGLNADQLRKRRAEAKKDYDDAVDTYRKFVYAQRELDEEDITNKTKAAKDREAVADANKTKGKSALEILKDRVKKQQDFLKAAAELEIKENELKLARGLINEFDFQNQRLRIQKEYLNRSIELENTLGDNKNKKTVTDYNADKIDAELKFTEFLQDQHRTRADYAKDAFEDAVKYHADSVERQKKKEQEWADSINQTQNDLINKRADDENKRFALEEARRGKTFESEVTHLAKLMEVYKHDAEQKKQLQTDLDLLIAQKHGEIRQGYLDLARQAEEAFFDNIAEFTTNKFGERIASLEAERERELAIAGNNAVAKEKIEASYAEKIQKVREKEAKAEKAQALLKIAVDTALALFKIKATAAALASNPLTVAYVPVALAQIPLVIAGAALSAAAIAARPIPKFAKGTKSAPSGAAIVGEEGFELMERGGRMFVTPGKPTLVNLQGGERIIPHDESSKAIERALKMHESERLTSSTQLHHRLANQLSQGRQLETISTMAKALGNGMSEAAMERAMTKALKTLSIEKNIWDERGYHKQREDVNSRVTYLNKQRF